MIKKAILQKRMAFFVCSIYAGSSDVLSVVD